jgi:hypothetical protein
MDILKNVDILELVRIYVYPGEPTREDPMPYRVEIQSIDPKKKVVFDEKALSVLNHRLTERAQEFDDGRDPRVVDYIKEFVGRMLSELSRNGLVVLDDISDEPEDPYAAVRKTTLNPRI